MDEKPPIGGPASAKGVNGLVLNLIVPGLGSIYCGLAPVGAAQAGLFVVGILLLFYMTLIGVLMIVGSWIWSAIVGFQLMSSTT